MQQSISSSTNLIHQSRNDLNVHFKELSELVTSKKELKIFMEHHVYAVWDFMSLVKSLQHHICPSSNLWLPTQQQRNLSRIINEIVLAEESDVNIDGECTSHFDLYLNAMSEIGADVTPITEFINCVTSNGIERALKISTIPEPSRKFMQSTFNVIATNEPHKIAAAFAYGRETVIPMMFKKLVDQPAVSNFTTHFKYYLNRHIDIDGNEHGPSSEKIVKFLCNNDPTKEAEAEVAAINAITSRIQFWDELKSDLVEISD